MKGECVMKSSIGTTFRSIYSFFLIGLVSVCLILSILIFVLPTAQGIGNLGLIFIPSFIGTAYIIFRFFITAFYLNKKHDEELARNFISTLFIIMAPLTLLMLLMPWISALTTIMHSDFSILSYIFQFGLRSPIFLPFKIFIGMFSFRVTLIWIIELIALTFSYFLYTSNKRRWAIISWFLPIILWALYFIVLRFYCVVG